MVAFDADKAVDNSKLNELNIFKKKTDNWEKKGILYFQRGDVTIEMAAVVKNNKGVESGKINTLVVKTGDDEPTWDVGGLNYDFNKFFNQIDNGKLDKVIKTIFEKADTVWGSALDDKLFGFDGNDTINGWQGNDRINGGAGKDTLKGYIGEDTFIFDQKLTKKNYDKINDFKVGEDTIELKQKIFTDLTKGDMEKSEFTVGKKAVGDKAQVIYNEDSGKLFYDPDGTGSEEKVQFAKISKHKELSHDDFFVA